MINIITEDNAIHIDNALMPKGSREISELSNGVRLTNVNKLEFLDVFTDITYIDGVKATSNAQLFEYFLENGFQKYDGSGGGGGDITVDQNYSPNSKNPQSGNAVKQAIESVKIDVDQTFKANSENPQSGKAVFQALSNVSSLLNENKLSNETELHLWAGTRAQYDAIDIKDRKDNTIYNVIN